MYTRSRYSITLNKPVEFVDSIMKDYITKKGFVQKQVNGEIVWQRGSGMLFAPRLLKYNYYNGIITMEAWLLIAILPGINIGETDLEGCYGVAIKKAYKKDIERLIGLLTQGYNQQMQQQYNQGYNQQAPYEYNQVYNQQVPQEYNQVYNQQVPQQYNNIVNTVPV